MKSLFKPTLLTIFTVVWTFSVSAQEFDDIFAAGIQDANTYLENYLRPGLNSFGVGMADGWYNTAKTHKTLGFDLTISANMAAIPEADKMFSFAKAGFENLHYRDKNTMLDVTGKLPTIVGGTAEEGKELYVPVGTTITDPKTGESITMEDELAFDAPDGFDLSDIPIVTGIPTPTVNLGIGIYKNTDLKIRFVPEISADGYSARLFGIGVMHDFKQWIPGIKNLPFDLSAFIGTTTMSAEYDIDVAFDGEADGGYTSRFEGQGKAEFKTHSTTVQAIISKKLLFFTPYAAIGFNAVKTTFDVKGDYTYTQTNEVLGTEETLTYTDPINLNFTGAGGARFTAGGQIKLAVLTLYAAYTFQQYNTFSAGFGISVR